MGDVALRGTQINVGIHGRDLSCILKFLAKQINKQREKEGDREIVSFIAIFCAAHDVL